MNDRNMQAAAQLTHLNECLIQVRESFDKLDPPLSPVFLGGMDYFMEQVRHYLEIIQ